MDEVKARYENGAFLVFIDAPKSMEFGIDAHLWTIGPKFMGVKMIPPGFHFVSYSVNPVSKQGFFRFFETGEVHVVKWDPATEDLLQVQDQDEVDRYRANLYNLDSMLGAYPLGEKALDEKYKRWLSLTRHISPQILAAIVPSDMHRFTSMTSSTIPDGTGIALQSETVDNTIHFTPVHLKQSFPASATGLDRSKYSKDKSWILSTLVSPSNPSDFFAEFELAFVLVLFGFNFEGFEQWKRMITCVCFAREASNSAAWNGFYMQVLDMIKIQLAEIPQDFFSDVISEGNFLEDCLIHLFSSFWYYGSVEITARAELKRKLDDLARFVHGRFEWDILTLMHEHEQKLDLEEGEDPPVIVKL